MAKVLNQDQGDLRERWQMPCRLSQWKRQRGPVSPTGTLSPVRRLTSTGGTRESGRTSSAWQVRSGEGTDLTSGLPSGKGHCASKSVLNL